MKDNGINKLVQAFNKAHNEWDVGKASAVLIMMAMLISRDHTNETYDHDVKKTMLKSNSVKNPLGYKYNEKDYHFYVNSFCETLRFLKAIVEYPEKAEDYIEAGNRLPILDGVIDDIRQLLLYTECFYNMNVVNSAILLMKTLSQPLTWKQKPAEQELLPTI